MRQALTISERRACGLVGLARTTLRRETEEPPETTSLRTRIIDLAYARRRFGYRRIHDLLRREGVRANHKRVYRLYREAAVGCLIKLGHEIRQPCREIVNPRLQFRIFCHSHSLGN